MGNRIDVGLIPPLKLTDLEAVRLTRYMLIFLTVDFQDLEVLW